MRAVAGLLATACVATSLAAASAASEPARLAPHPPTTPQHTEFVVETNRKGQVVRVRSGKSAPDLFFNAQTYGNALQTFIRKPDGSAVAGTYRLSYDYTPRDQRVRRTVQLLRAGYVNPEALGAVDVEAEKLRREQQRHAAPAPSPSVLPDLKAITGHKH